MTTIIIVLVPIWLYSHLLFFLVHLVTELTFTQTMNFAQVQVGKGRPTGWCPAQPGVETQSSF